VGEKKPIGEGGKRGLAGGVRRTCLYRLKGEKTVRGNPWKTIGRKIKGEPRGSEGEDRLPNNVRSNQSRTTRGKRRKASECRSGRDSEKSRKGETSTIADAYREVTELSLRQGGGKENGWGGLKSEWEGPETDVTSAGEG